MNTRTDIKDSRPLFADSSRETRTRAASESLGLDTAEPWKVAVVDDDPDVHAVTRLVVTPFRYKGRPVKLFHAHSGEEARHLFRKEKDIAVVLLDVVMETEHAGLDLVKFIREDLNNTLLRIILRTGQPGQAPEGSVISSYDINDYKEKSELSAQRLITALTTGLRGYDDLITIQALASSKESLEAQVQLRTAELSESNYVLKQQRALLAEAQQIARIGNYEMLLDSSAMTWSDQVYRILGVDSSNVLPSLERLIAASRQSERDEITSRLDDAIRSGGRYSFEHSLERPDGEMAHVLLQGEVHVSSAGKPARLVGIIQDVTEQHNTTESMRKLSAAVEQTADSIMITDVDGKIEYVNAAFTRMSGYEAQEAVGNTPRILKSGEMPEVFYRRIWHSILRGEIASDVFVNRHKDGRIYHEARTITPQRNAHGEITHFIATGRDITEQIEIQERIQHLAHHDALTGLPNRILLLDRIEQAMPRSKWRSHHVAVLFMDMDRFKVINDTLGHTTGDKLLVAMGRRLEQCVREGDTVARLGGDEFAIVLNDVAHRVDVERRAQAIIDALREPFVIDGRELFVTTSIGISVFPQDGEYSQVLLKRADVAMYNAKARGKNNYQFYTERDEAEELERLSLETALRWALERQEFFLVYQPQVDARTGRILCIEALLRWQRPEVGVVPPGGFIDLLEETGMIQAVGEWVLRKACAEVQAMRNEGLPPCRIAVNISLNQFRQPDFVDRVTQILGDTGLPAEALELEITEGVLVDDVQEATQTLHKLNALGIHLSIDDFGTGYSSMHYLRRLPFDTLKIDKSFIDGLPSSPDAIAIVTAIITMARSMELEVVAEGVENKEQLGFLETLECDLIQGYFFNPPLMADVVREILRDGKKGDAR